MILEFDELAEEEIRLGDLIFIMADRDNGLEQTVSHMNSTWWCHVGIACGDGMVASARSNGGLLALGAGGGIRLDPLTWYRETLGRDVFVGRVGRTGSAGEPEDPRFEARRRSAAEVARRLSDEKYTDQTRFSWSKTILAGIARRGADYWTMIESDALTGILEHADLVGRSWEATARWPVFASAEFVAAAYGFPFTRAALEGPMIITTERAAEPDYEEIGRELVREQLPGRRWARFAHLLELLERHEDNFLRPAVTTFGQWWRQGEPGPELVPRPPSSPKREEVPGADQTIGSALVSARMLEKAWWVEKIDIVRP